MTTPLARVPGREAPGERGLVLAHAALAASVLICTCLGWRLFWFLTDDSFIAFRYVHNAVVGRGLVWNPSPFRPVEGYTSFLWVVVLEATWRLTGVLPPVSANPLALLFGFGTLGIAYRFVARSFDAPRGAARLSWGGLALTAIAAAGLVASRTFLAWLSSGLETSMFNFFTLGWLYALSTRDTERGPRWLLRVSGWAALAALTRPDGLLFVAATLAAAAHEASRTRRFASAWQASPLLAVVAHTLWRRAFYGAWFPNTYYAKLVAPWPEAGIRYLACYVLESGAWLTGLLLVASAVLFVRRRGLAGAIEALRASHVGAAIAVAAITLQIGYYVLRVGGDHFEYRVFSHLVPLQWVLSVQLVRSVFRRLVASALALLALVAVSLPIPWTHWARTHDLTARTTFLRVRIADAFPSVLQPVVEQWDTWQDYLISHAVCMRHQEHKNFQRYVTRSLPTREEGLRMRWDDPGGPPVGNSGTVGVLGWVLPNVAILDMQGLNDWVIARAPIPPGQERRMAHDRAAPPGYLECFRPDVDVVHKIIQRTPRERPLTAIEIVACESASWPPPLPRAPSHD